MIGERGGRFFVRVYRPSTKRKEWVGTFATRREARKAEREAEMRFAQPTATVRKRAGDCAAYAAWWLGFKAPAQAASTNNTNRYALKAFIEDFRGVPVAAVDRVRAETWARAEVRGRASNTRVVSVMFADAVTYGDHPGPNPFAGLGKSSRKARRRLDPDWLTEPQVHQLADLALHTCGAFGPQFRAMILFAAYVGLRPGELFALERRDARGDLVEIRQAVGADGKLKAPKNGNTRVVLLPPQAASALRDLVVWPDLPWLFVTPEGNRFSKGTHYTRWNPTRAMFGRPGMDFYELRHFCATHLLQLGVSDADVAHQLGHSDGGKLVRDTYGHPADRYALDRLRSAYGAQVVTLDSRAGRITGRKAR